MVSVIKRGMWNMGEGLLMSSWGPGKGLRTLTLFIEKYNPTVTPLPDVSNMIYMCLLPGWRGDCGAEKRLLPLLNQRETHLFFFLLSLL